MAQPLVGPVQQLTPDGAFWGHGPARAGVCRDSEVAKSVEATAGRVTCRMSLTPSQQLKSAVNVSEYAAARFAATAFAATLGPGGTGPAPRGAGRGTPAQRNQCCSSTRGSGSEWRAAGVELPAAMAAAAAAASRWIAATGTRWYSKTLSPPPAGSTSPAADASSLSKYLLHCVKILSITSISSSLRQRLLQYANIFLITSVSSVHPNRCVLLPIHRRRE